MWVTRRGSLEWGARGRGARFLPADQIRIYDDTLREGEQMAGVAFSPRQKLALAELFSRVGVHVINLAFPAVSKEEGEAVVACLRARRCGRIRPEVEIQVMCRADQGEINAAAGLALQAGVAVEDLSILLLSSVSGAHVQRKLGETLLRREGISILRGRGRSLDWFLRANTRLIVDAIGRARQVGFRRIEFGGEDSSRADPRYLLRWAEACLKAGGTRLSFCDTVGCLSPEDVDALLPPLIQLTRFHGGDFHAHFHNDLGLASSNCLRALSLGATHAGVSVGGVGERAGMAALEQVVMQLRLLYGITLPGFRYDLLTEARRRVEECSGIFFSAHAPVVGEGAFAHESGLHTAAVAKDPSLYQIIPESQVGGKKTFVFGKHSGRAGVAAALRGAGVSATNQEIDAVRDQVKSLRSRHIDPALLRRRARAHYRNYRRLGIQSSELVRLARRVIKKGVQEGKRR